MPEKSNSSLPSQAHRPSTQPFSRIASLIKCTHGNQSAGAVRNSFTVRPPWWNRSSSTVQFEMEVHEKLQNSVSMHRASDFRLESDHNNKRRLLRIVDGTIDILQPGWGDSRNHCSRRGKVQEGQVL